MTLAALLSCLCFAQTAAGPQGAAAVDPALRTAIERFYAAQEAEDVDAYMALWSAKGERPQILGLKTVFDGVDDRFSDLTILRVFPAAGSVRVDVNVQRHRSVPNRTPGRPPFLHTAVVRSALIYVREDGEWKLLRESSPADALAAALLDAGDAAGRDALLAAEPDLLDVPLLNALSRRANVPALAGAYPRAQAIYEIVLELARRAGAKKEEGEALQNIANALYFQRRFPDALATYEARLALERERGNDEAVASALVGIATIRYSFAEYSAALARYREALAIQERIDDVMGTAMTLISTGNVRYLQGDFDGAVRDYTRSLELQRRMFHKDGEARALEGLGRTYSAQGNYAAALEAFAGVLEEGRARSDHPRQGFATQSIATVHFRLGNLDAARANYETSRGHFEAAGDQASLGRVWQGLGLTELAAGKYAAAEQAYVRGRAACAAAGDRACAAHGVVGLAFAQGAQDRFTDAIASYRKAIGEFEALGEREDAARAEIGLSQVLRHEGEHGAAIEAARRARRTAVALDTDDLLWRALTAEARALRQAQARSAEQPRATARADARASEVAEALGVARAAVSAIDRVHAAALEKPGASAPQDATEGWATLAVLQALSGDARGAFESTGRLRALDLRATLAAHEREIARGMSPEERQAERGQAMELNSLHAQLARHKELPKPDAAQIALLEKRVAEATLARTEAMDRLFTRFPELRLWRGLAPPPTADDAAAILRDPGTLLVQFVVDEDDLLTVTASAGEKDVQIAAYVTPIRKREIAERVAALQQPAVLGDRAAWMTAARSVAALIPPPVMAQLAAARRAIVVPHEMLWRVPFGALPLEDGYLIDRVDVIYSASLAALLTGTSESAPGPDALTAIGGAELTEATRARLKQTAPGWTARPDDESTREAEAVAAAHGVETTPMVLTGAHATESAWRAQGPSARVLHIAAPLRINGASPLFSPVLLGGDPQSKDGTRDGSLEIREVMNMELQASVAVLADGTALSMRDSWSALQTVQWAWLAAGVRSLLVTRWTAEAGGELMSAFHRQLREGASPPDALRRARDEVRARPETSAPVHWAGWMLLTGSH